MSAFRYFSITDFSFEGPLLPLHAAHTEKDMKGSDSPSSDLNIPYTVFEVLVAIVSIIGNVLVIIVFRRERKLRRRTNYYIVSLAMADLLVLRLFRDTFESEPADGERVDCKFTAIGNSSTFTRGVIREGP